jgi:hypothetical protein
VYNLRVADFHTYFVGCDEWGFSVWAHNATYGEQVGEAPSAMLKSIRRKFEMKGIADNPTWNELWQQSIDTLISRPNNVVKRFMEGKMKPTDTVEKVFDAVKGEFKAQAKAGGVKLPEEPIHHWNWNKEDFPHQVIEPENLFFTPDRLHNANNQGIGANGVHQTLQDAGLHPTVDPIPDRFVRPVSAVRWRLQ